MKIGILLISTGKYGIFLQPLLDGIDKYFFVGKEIEIYLFTDKTHDLKHSNRINVIHIPIEHKPFPYSTIYRYSFFSKASDIIKTDFLFYSDVDMGFCDFVGEEILPNGIDDGGLVATHHPAFYHGGWGSNNVNPLSTAYIPIELRKRYVAGGFNGGETKAFLDMSKQLSENIEKDDSVGVMAEWHDESHLNCYMSTRSPKLLTPDYCMVEEQHLREQWGINNFAPKIIALKKNHEEIRNA